MTHGSDDSAAGSQGCCHATSSDCRCTSADNRNHQRFFYDGILFSDGVDILPTNRLPGADDRVIQGARRAGNADIFENMSRRPNKRNAVDMPDCAPAVETL